MHMRWVAECLLVQNVGYPTSAETRFVVLVLLLGPLQSAVQWANPLDTRVIDCM